MLIHFLARRERNTITHSSLTCLCGEPKDGEVMTHPTLPLIGLYVLPSMVGLVKLSCVRLITVRISGLANQRRVGHAFKKPALVVMQTRAAIVN